MTAIGNSLTVNGTVSASQATKAGECVVLGADGKIPSNLYEGGSGSDLSFTLVASGDDIEDYVLEYETDYLWMPGDFSNEGVSNLTASGVFLRRHSTTTYYVMYPAFAWAQYYDGGGTGYTMGIEGVKLTDGKISRNLVSLAFKSSGACKQLSFNTTVSEWGRLYKVNHLKG